MNLYAETTAVVGWLLGEQLGSSVRRALQSAQRVFSSDLTLIECDRTLRRLTATGRLNFADTAATRSRLERAASGWALHRITPRVAERSRSAFPVEPIRSLDAIQLATALVIREIQPELRILSLDRRVRENAAALGFDVAPNES